MIISDYSNSVNRTDVAIAEQQIADAIAKYDVAIDDAIESTDDQIASNDELLAGLDIDLDRRPSPRVIEVDIIQDFGTKSWPWHWIKRMRDGLLDRTSTEYFETAQTAAFAAERIAQSCGAVLGPTAQQQIEYEKLHGYIARLFDQPESECQNEHQLMGYHERIDDEQHPSGIAVIDSSWY